MKEICSTRYLYSAYEFYAPDELLDSAQAFRMYDGGGDNAIDTGEFLKLMSSLGLHLSLHEAQDMVTEAHPISPSRP